MVQIVTDEQSQIHILRKNRKLSKKENFVNHDDHFFACTYIKDLNI